MERSLYRALFMQLVDASRLLEDLAVGDDIHLSVVAADERSEGTVPSVLLTRAPDEERFELPLDGHHWLIERAPLRAPGQREAIAQIVLARKTDLGLAGLFPQARVILGALAFGFGALAIGGLGLARRRDLTRRPIRRAG